MRLSKQNNEGLAGMLLDQTRHLARNAEIAASNAPHVVTRMAVHAVNRNSEFSRRIKDRLIRFPVAAPFFVISNTVEELLFGDLSAHPGVKDLLVTRKNRFDGQSQVLLRIRQFLQQRRSIILTRRQS